MKRPQRDLPIGIIASLLICTALYIIVSLILTGIVPYGQLNISDPVAFALQFIGQDSLASNFSRRNYRNHNSNVSYDVWASTSFICNE